MNPAFISAGASLLGGLFSRNSARKAQDRQNAYNTPANIRARAEAGGFNPLLWAGTGNIQTHVAPSGQMGNAIANAGLYYADGKKDEQALEIEKSRLAMDRQKLDALLQQNTIRPKTGGIYSGMDKTPTRGGVGSAKTTFNGVAVSPFEPEAGSGGIDRQGNSKTAITLNGQNIARGDNSDAEMGETAYGEIGGEILGLSNLFSDFGTHLRKSRFNDKKHSSNLDAILQKRANEHRWNTRKKLPPLEPTGASKNTYSESKQKRKDDAVNRRKTTTEKYNRLIKELKK